MALVEEKRTQTSLPAVAGFFMVCVVIILIESVREWIRVLSGRKQAVSSEVPFMHTQAATL